MVSLKKIDETNFIQCFGLKLKQGQERFVSTPVRSLAQAYVYYNQCTPFGVYAVDKMVGYVMVIDDYDEETYNGWHLMIDAQEQGKGYGRAAMQSALEYIKTKPFGASDVVLITCGRENTAAYSMYKAMGFKETGRSDEEEDELYLKV